MRPTVNRCGHKGIGRFVAGAFLIAALALCETVLPAPGEVKLPNVFGDHMILQRDKVVRVWGWAQPGARIRVRFAGQDKSAVTGDEGTWSVDLDAMPASATGRRLIVEGGGKKIMLTDVLVGDVWLCGGQSNMEDVLESVYHGDVEVASANFPQIRLLTIPVNAGPEPLSDFPRIDEFNAWTGRTEKKGSWFACSPETVDRFSAIGYVFGRRLYMAARVPIGLVDVSRGGTTAEAWTSRKTLEAIPEAKPLLAHWDARIAAFDPEKDLEDRIKRWEKDTENRKKEGREPAPKPEDLRPGPAFDRNNPGASYNGMIAPFAGFAVKGAIFNQGYNNALGDARPALYAKCLQDMIRDWRRAFRDEQMPFGFVELTAGGEPQTLENFETKMDDPGPFIREAQFNAYLALPHVGFACAYDQQVPWYHPHKKVQLGERIARWALATQYGLERIGWRPAVCTSAKPEGGHIVLTFDRRVQTHDGRPFEGFAIAGADKQFYPARARYVVTGKDDRGRDREDRKKLEIWSKLVDEPVAVRYAWARNPLGNLVNAEHHERILPAPSFRTDDWDWEETPFDPEARNEVNRRRREMRNRSREKNQERKLREARLLLQKLEAEAAGHK